MIVTNTLVLKTTILLTLFGCASTSIQVNKQWEHIYEDELLISYEHNDTEAFHFFWPLYFEERPKNKNKH